MSKGLDWHSAKLLQQRAFQTVTMEMTPSAFFQAEILGESMVSALLGPFTSLFSSVEPMSMAGEIGLHNIANDGWS